MNLSQEYQDYVEASFGEVAKGIRKDSRSLRNRIQSICSDARFVATVSAAYGLPLVGISTP